MQDEEIQRDLEVSPVSVPHEIELRILESIMHGTLSFVQEQYGNNKVSNTEHVKSVSEYTEL